MHWRFWQRELRRGPCYPILRAAAEKVYGDLSLPGERSWPEHGCPFDEYDGEGNLHGFDRAEHIEMRRWCGRARAVPPGYDASGSPVPWWLRERRRARA